MKKSILVLITISGLLPAPCLAQEESQETDKHEVPEEFREFDERLREIHDLGQSGKVEEAEEHKRALHKLMEQRPEIAARFREFQEDREREEVGRELDRLHGALEEAEHDGNEREMEEIRGVIERLEHGEDANDHEADFRIRNLLAAAELLQDAGYPDDAHELRERAERIEAEHMGRHAEHIEREVAELREAVQELQAQIEELRKRKKRD